MKIEQAINYVFGGAFLTDPTKDRELREIILEALEKQKPKKPYDIDREMKSFDCPSCLSSLWSEDELENTGYCCICGQALLWEDTE